MATPGLVGIGPTEYALPAPVALRAGTYWVGSVFSATARVGVDYVADSNPVGNYTLASVSFSATPPSTFPSSSTSTTGANINFYVVTE